MGSKMSEFVLEMCPAYSTRTQALRRRRVSLVPGKRRCRVLMRWGAVLLKHKKCLRTTCACLAVASKQESCRDSMSSSLWHQIWLLSNLIVINQVLGKILEHLRLTRQCSDVGQVRWKMYYIAYNFSHFAIYLQKPIKIRGNLTKFWQKQKCTVFLWHGVVRSLGLT